MRDSLSDYEKLVSLMSFTSTNLTYGNYLLFFDYCPFARCSNETDWDASQKPVNIIKNGTGWCKEYSLAFLGLASTFGFDGRIVTLETTRGHRHIITECQVDGSWFAFDPLYNFTTNYSVSEITRERISFDHGQKLFTYFTGESNKYTTLNAYRRICENYYVVEKKSFRNYLRYRFSWLIPVYGNIPECW